MDSHAVPADGPMAGRPQLAAAAVRLRGRPGRPRKAVPPPRTEDREAEDRAARRARRAAKKATALEATPVRLFDVEAAARYTSVSAWTLREWIEAGVLPRVRLLSASGRELRKVLIDRADLDDLILRMKETK